VHQIILYHRTIFCLHFGLSLVDQLVGSCCFGSNALVIVVEASALNGLMNGLACSRTVAHTIAPVFNAMQQRDGPINSFILQDKEATTGVLETSRRLVSTAIFTPEKVHRNIIHQHELWPGPVVVVERAAWQKDTCVFFVAAEATLPKLFDVTTLALLSGHHSRENPPSTTVPSKRCFAASVSTVVRFEISWYPQ
jgi:hypothetical protein